MSTNVLEFLDELFETMIGEDNMETHDCDNCKFKGNCPIEDTVRQAKMMKSSSKEDDKKSSDSSVFKFMKNFSQENKNPFDSAEKVIKELKQEKDKENLETMKNILDDIFFGGKVPKEVKEQTDRIERIVNAKNQLNSNIEKLLFATTKFGKKIDGHPDFTHVESFAKHIEEINRKMEDLIKHYESSGKKKRTKDDFRKDAEEMFNQMVKMIIETFNLGTKEEKALTQDGLIRNYDKLYQHKIYRNIARFKIHLTKYIHLESKAIKHLITSNEVGSSYLLEILGDIIIRTFIETEYVEERDAE